jgi:DNA recombination protein RmuC
MDELLCKMNEDSTFMVMVAIAIVILLFVVLMIVISSMRIKGYKDRFLNTQIDNQEKDLLIDKLQNELKDLQIQNAKNEQELQLFGHTKEKLQETEERFEVLQTTSAALEKLQGETRTELDHTHSMLGKLTEEHETIREKFESLQEDNNKMHVNNARLLIKLESETRFASELAKKTKNGDE